MRLVSERQVRQSGRPDDASAQPAAWLGRDAGTASRAPASTRERVQLDGLTRLLLPCQPLSAEALCRVIPLDNTISGGRYLASSKGLNGLFEIAWSAPGGALERAGRRCGRVRARAGAIEEARAGRARIPCSSRRAPPSSLLVPAHDARLAAVSRLLLLSASARLRRRRRGRAFVARGSSSRSRLESRGRPCRRDRGAARESRRVPPSGRPRGGVVDLGTDHDARLAADARLLPFGGFQHLISQKATSGQS